MGAMTSILRRRLAPTLAVVLALLAWAGAPVAAQESVRWAFTPKHRAASSLVPTTLPFLTAGGSVELHDGGRTLVVLDTPAAVAKIVPLLRDLDQPLRDVTLAIRVLRATTKPQVGGDPGRPVGGDLARRLATLLPNRSLQLLAEQTVATAEGSRVLERITTDLTVSFDVGALLGGQRLRLEGFRLDRTAKSGAATLLRGDVTVWIDRPIALAISEASGGEALVLVVEGRLNKPTPAVGGDPTRIRPRVGGDPAPRRN
jgi:hypothetical protein